MASSVPEWLVSFIFKSASRLLDYTSTALDGELPPVTDRVLVPDLLLSLSCLALFTFGDWVPL